MVSLKLKMDDSFFQAEEREGYLVSSEMKKVWAVELDLLNEFSRVCEILGIKWFVHAGTMLGAVRHHGFIPWDDDIDVVLPREDYDRLCEMGPSFFTHPFFFQNENTDQYFARNFTRLRRSDTTAILDNEKEFQYPFNQGIFIDIFPMDHIPADVAERNVYYGELSDLNKRSWLWRTMIHFYRPKIGKGLVKRISFYLKHIYFKYLFKGGYRYYMEKHHKLITKYNGEETGWVGESIIDPLGRQLWRSEWVQEIKMVPFEMLNVPIPACYDECLTASFGSDWRIPRRAPSFHGGVFFDTEKPYTEYLAQK